MFTKSQQTVLRAVFGCKETPPRAYLVVKGSREHKVAESLVALGVCTLTPDATGRRWLYVQRAVL